MMNKENGLVSTLTARELSCYKDSQVSFETPSHSSNAQLGDNQRSMSASHTATTYTADVGHNFSVDQGRSSNAQTHHCP